MCIRDRYNDIYDDLVGSYYDSSSSIGEDPAFGFMYISIALGSFSLTKLSDDNPINMLDFIANIGGFWGEYTSSSSPVNITRTCLVCWLYYRCENHPRPGYSNPCPCIPSLSSPHRLVEVLLVAWGVFFITRHNDTGPKQVARDFAKAIKRCFERNNSSVNVAGPSPSSAVASRAESDGEEHPNGGIAPGGPSNASGNNIGGRASVDQSTV